MLDAKKVKAFWDNRSRYYNQQPFESIVNLEQDPENLDLKIREETSKVFAWLPDVMGKRVLDLGAGIGQWAFRFQKRRAESVTAVEFSESLVSIGREEACQRGVDNVHFVVASAEDYTSNELFDIVLISGLMVYLNDCQAEKLLSHLVALTTPETVILLRDGTGTAGRYEINNRFSEVLDTEYSATYRTAEQYTTLFARYGFQLLKQEDMFPEGHILNKYPQTRLRLYRFQKKNG